MWCTRRPCPRRRIQHDVKHFPDIGFEPLWHDVDPEREFHHTTAVLNVDNGLEHGLEGSWNLSTDLARTGEGVKMTACRPACGREPDPRRMG